MLRLQILICLQHTCSIEVSPNTETVHSGQCSSSARSWWRTLNSEPSRVPTWSERSKFKFMLWREVWFNMRMRTLWRRGYPEHAHIVKAGLSWACCTHELTCLVIKFAKHGSLQTLHSRSSAASSCLRTRIGQSYRHKGPPRSPANFICRQDIIRWTICGHSLRDGPLSDPISRLPGQQQVSRCDVVFAEMLKNVGQWYDTWQDSCTKLLQCLLIYLCGQGVRKLYGVCDRQ